MRNVIGGGYEVNSQIDRDAPAWIDRVKRMFHSAVDSDRRFCRRRGARRVVGWGRRRGAQRAAFHFLRLMGFVVTDLPRKCARRERDK